MRLSLPTARWPVQASLLASVDLQSSRRTIIADPSGEPGVGKRTLARRIAGRGKPAELDGLRDLSGSALSDVDAIDGFLITGVEQIGGLPPVTQTALAGLLAEAPAIELPALRDRGADVVVLAGICCRRHARLLSQSARGLDEDAAEALTAYHEETPGDGTWQSWMNSSPCASGYTRATFGRRPGRRAVA